VPLKRSLVITLAVLVVLVVGAGAVLVTRDSDDSSPDAVVRTYYDAFVNGDCDRMADQLTEESLVQEGQTVEETMQLCEQAFDDPELDMDIAVDEVSTVSEEGDTATVEVTVTAAGETNTSNVPVVREDGQWKIDALSFEEDAATDAEGSTQP
jgi:hypothetical protein